MQNGVRTAVVFVAGLIVGGVVFSGFALATGSQEAPVSVRSSAVVRGGASAPFDRAQAVVNGYVATASRMRGFTAFTHPFPGEFCFKLPKSVKPGTYVALTTPEQTGSPDSDISVQWYVGASACPSNAWVEVQTFKNGTTSADEGFAVVVP